MASDQTMGPDSAGDGHTQLGARRAGPAASSPTDESGTTQLGRRATGAPATGTVNTQLGRRERDEDTSRPSAGTQLGQRRRAVPAPNDESAHLDLRPATAHEAASARGTQFEDQARISHESTGPAAPTGHDTQLGRRRQGTADTGLGHRVGGPSAVDPPAAGDAVATSNMDDEDVVRFGPGVPRTPPSSPEWSRRPTGTGTRKKRRRPWIGALVTIALVSGTLAWLLIHVSDPLQANAQQVTASSPSGACDTVVDVVGTIATNGRPGSITYQWTRNDGQPTDVLTQTVTSGETSTPVHMHWSFSGHGRLNAVATLRVLDPAPASQASGAFTYSCP